jgi:Smr domain
MNIGDKVRFLHGTEEGIVKRILKDGLIEVEIEEGFCIPSLKSELSLVAAAETQFFKKNTVASDTKEEAKPIIPRAEKGIYLSFLPDIKGNLTVMIGNNTDWQLPFSLCYGADTKNTGLMAGTLQPKAMQEADVTLRMSDFEEWSTLHFQCFYFQKGTFGQKNPFSRKFRLRANSFFQHKTAIPLLGKEGYLVQLDAVPTPPATLNPTALKESMLGGKAAPILADELRKIQQPSRVVDLHIEKLTDRFQHLSNADMITMQLAVFQQKFEDAIATGLDEITFIHGVGSGKLREEVHRVLAKHPNVDWFKDAQKEKFGYGATLVRIK